MVTPLSSMNLADPAVLDTAYQLPAGGIHVLPRVFQLMVIMQATSASRKYICCVRNQYSGFPASVEPKYFMETG